jgi:hypothetical protein
LSRWSCLGGNDLGLFWVYGVDLVYFGFMGFIGLIWLIWLIGANPKLVILTRPVQIKCALEQIFISRESNTQVKRPRCERVPSEWQA